MVVCLEKLKFTNKYFDGLEKNPSAEHTKRPNPAGKSEGTRHNHMIEREY